MLIGLTGFLAGAGFWLALCGLRVAGAGFLALAVADQLETAGRRALCKRLGRGTSLAGNGATGAASSAGRAAGRVATAPARRAGV